MSVQLARLPIRVRFGHGTERLTIRRIRPWHTYYLTLAPFPGWRLQIVARLLPR